MYLRVYEACVCVKKNRACKLLETPSLSALYRSREYDREARAAPLSSPTDARRPARPSSTSMALHCAAAASVSPSTGPCPLPRQHHRQRALWRSPFQPQRPHSLASAQGPARLACGARRRVRHEEEEEDEEEYGHNEEMARLEAYSEGARDLALLVTAAVDGDLESVLVFKGFSSSLSGRTAPDPAMSVLPERAVIQSVDVVKGPFDPNNIEYLEKDLPWEEFKSRLQ